MTSKVMAPTRPTVCAVPVAFADSWTAWSTFCDVANPNATPAAASRVMSSTAIPVAVSQPKNAEPIFT